MKKAFIQLHIAVFLAGFTGILGRLITLNEGLLVWYRVLFSAIALFLIAWMTGRKLKVTKNELFRLILVGATMALHWVFFYGSIKYANVSIGLVCFSAVGFFTAIINPVITKHSIDFVEVALGLLVMLGIYLIFHFDGQYRLGIILGIIGAVLAALFTIWNKKLLEKIDARVLTTYELAGGWLALTLLLPLYLYLFPADHIVPTLPDFLWLLALSLLCTVLAVNLSMLALKKISPFTVSLTYNLEPVYGILLAFAVYHENKYLGPGFYIGFGIILISVVLQSYRVWRVKRRSKPDLTEN
jgi:drug/metabolite transporter (DMT)-like permease